MPIVENQSSVFPVDLFNDLPTTPSGQEWRVLYTKSRQEKAVARELVAREVPFYLPLIPKRNYIRGRVVLSQIPVFAGYVFTYGDDDDRVSSLKTNRICCVLPVYDQELFQAPWGPPWTMYTRGYFLFASNMGGLITHICTCVPPAPANHSTSGSEKTTPSNTFPLTSVILKRSEPSVLME